MVTPVILAAAPLAFGYACLYSAETFYQVNNCSRIDRLGSLMCETSHTVFVSARKSIVRYIDQGLSAFVGMCVGWITVRRRHTATTKT